MPPGNDAMSDQA